MLFRDIIGYEGLYKISDTGLVIAYPKAGKRERSLKAAPTGTVEYLCVKLTNYHGRKNIMLHRLLAIHFIPNPENLNWVNHKDGNKLNNALSNLEWCTSGKNQEHAYEMKLKPSIKDKATNKTRAVNQFKGNGEFIKSFTSISSAARSVLASATHVKQNCDGELNHCKGYVFQYAS